MDSAPGSRGTVIGDRYRVAGALRRTGLIDAIDLEADPPQAACRLVAVPGDDERVDAWEDAWRAAQQVARLPRLREIVPDDDGAHWAVLEPSQAVAGPPTAAHATAAQIGAALAEAGLDADDVTASMLGADAAGALVVDGVVWLGGDRSPRAAGRRIADLLPPAMEPRAVEPPPVLRSRRRGSRRRLLVPAAIAVALAAAAAVLLVPAGSADTSTRAPAAPTAPDVLLGSAPAVAAPAPVRRTRPTAPSPSAATAAPRANAPADAPVPAVVSAAPPSAPEVVVPEIPTAPVPDLPVAEPVPALPVADEG